jgi:hypothetical protein
MHTALACVLAGTLCASARGAKLVEVRTVDDEYLMVHWLDGEAEYVDNGQGPTAFKGHPDGGAILHRYTPALDTAAASTTASYTLTSKDDPAFAQAVHPTAAYRKTKLNGTDNKWPEANFTLEHTIFLKLPQKLQQGKHYTLSIAPATNTNTPSRDFTFDIYSSISEAIHVNIIGYHPDHPIKPADLYMWLGDGGGRDYSAYAGKRITLYNVDTGAKTDVGAVTFWKKSGQDCGNWDFTKADVWNCDFSSFTGTGKYRLAIEGVGCSPDFQISRDIYFEPYKTSVRGFYYMRIGEPKPTDGSPVPRQPRYIPDQDPAGFKVYMTGYGPWHPDWSKKGGDQWDNRDWSMYKDPGEPTNPNAYGGHSDAGDWDRNLGHISIIWDMLLPYYLSNGKLSEDNLQIRESGNGIPDIIDEARNEVDFWLRLRDSKGGYSAGLNNPDEKKNIMYQAAASPYMAWASAANAAMLADCFRIAGKTDLANHYRDAALEAWKTANEDGLDLHSGIGNGQMRGRDLKMLAAAHLYNLTGDTRYEDIVAKESVATSPTAELDNERRSNQYWATAAYLLCAQNKLRPIHYPDLLANMKASVLNEAKRKNVDPSNQRPSRRSSNAAYGWFQSTQEVQILTIAHAIATNPADKDAFLKAMLLEADWGLGRNPMNLVQMTGLGSRHAENIYTTGRNDGVPGVHPGHTPYMNAGTWWKGNGAYMSDPQWMAAKGYPAWNNWPQGEALWNAPYCYANSEFTPQQTMRGKMALLGYLYSLGERHTAK